MKKSNRILIALPFAALAILACGQPGDLSLKSHPQEAPATVSKPAEPPPPKPIMKEEVPAPTPPPAPKPPIVTIVNRTERISIEEKQKVDIIFVDDNSISMAYEQKQMADKFKNFITSLKGLDWQIAIITTDVALNAPGKDGRFLKFPNGRYFLSSNDSDKSNQDNFSKTIQRPPKEGNQYEQGIKATYRTIERSLDANNIENSAQKQFFRSDAALAVVFISDADESIPKGKTAEIRNSPEAILDLIKNTWKDKKTIFHSIIVQPDDQKCLKSNNNEAFGLKYAELSKLTGGVISSVCETDYGKSLQFMGEKTQQIVNNWALQCDGAEDLVLTDSNQTPVKMGMAVKGQRVHFNQSLPAGEYVLSYTCKIVTPAK